MASPAGAATLLDARGRGDGSYDKMIFRLEFYEPQPIRRPMAGG